jgi:D-alanyl-D-alanine carboxypeptidase
MKDLQEAFVHLDRFIEQKMRATKIPGVSLAITSRVKLLRTATFGLVNLDTQAPMTTETMFYTGSNGKTFTGAAVLQLHEEGLVDIHQPVTRYLPWFEIQSNYAPITLHHLLCHTSGIPHRGDVLPDPLYEIWTMRERETAFPPGEKGDYTTLNTRILGLVLEAVLGQPYGDIIQQRLLDPLGMTNTVPVLTHDVRLRIGLGYVPLFDDRPPHLSHPLVPAPWLQANFADACMATTPTDLARYLRMLMNRGQGPEGRILSEESYERMVEPVALRDEDSFFGAGLMTNQVEGCFLIGHNGSGIGHGAVMWADLDCDLGVVIMSNCAFPYIDEFFPLQILRAAVQDRALPPLPPVFDPHKVDNAGEYAGTYRCGDRCFTLTEEDGRLVMHYQEKQVPLERRGVVLGVEGGSEDSFFVDHPDFAFFLLKFGRNDDSEIVEAFHGSDWYTHERYAGPTHFDYPEEWNTYVGHYRVYNPWRYNFRVVLRKGQLFVVEVFGWLYWETGLVPREEGGFTLGEGSPELIFFDTIVDNQALRAWKGCGYYYRFTLN